MRAGIKGLAWLGLAAWATIGTALAAEVNLYTTREPGLIKPLLDAYTARTGTTVNTVFVEKGLAERVAAILILYAAMLALTARIGQVEAAAIAAPLALAGLVFAVDGLRDLVLAALDGRRITVKRVVR